MTTRGAEPGLRPAVILAQGTGSLGAARVLGRRGVPVIAVLWDPVTPIRHSRYARRIVEVPPGTAAEREAYLLRLLTSLGEDRPVLLASSDRLIEFIARHRAELAPHFALCAPSFALIEVLNDKAREVADEIKKIGGTCLLVKANLADPKEARAMVKRVADQFGHLDVLVNNAGITRDKQLAKMTDEEWLEVIGTNLNACFFCTSAAIPIMSAQSYGRIVNISSMNGQVGAFGQANYSASKGGIIAFTRTAALELSKSNITVNVIAPGYTETDMFAKVPAEIQARIASMTCARTSTARSGATSSPSISSR